MTQNSVTGTAVGPMVIAALDQYERHPIVRDEYAAGILPTGAGRLVRLARWAPLRRWIVRMGERKIPGLRAIMLCRKRYIDDRLLEALADGAQAVVVLGAGLDTRGCRLPDDPPVPVFEVDLPANIELKRRRLVALRSSVPEHVHLVSQDFETTALSDVLAQAGHDMATRTLYIWEGVTQYLTEDGVRGTLDFLSHAASGSRLTFTYVQRDFLDGTNLYGTPGTYRDFVQRGLWKFGLHPDEVDDLLAEYGWRTIENVGLDELAERYLKPAGRQLSTTGLERLVTAEKS